MSDKPTNKTTYPKISRRNWWLLRERLKKSMPTLVSTTLVSSVAQMTDSSARSNVLGPLRELGLIDENNKPTDLMEKWRHDDEYAAVCNEIRTSIYPAELVEAFSSPSSEQKGKISGWFMKNAKVGEAAANMYADTYILLSEADPTSADDAVSKPRTPKQSTPKTEKSKVVSRTSTTPVAEQVTNMPEGSKNDSQNTKSRVPSIHIDVQVHISPDTSPEQIDRIFESMSKHLSKFAD